MTSPEGKGQNYHRGSLVNPKPNSAETKFVQRASGTRSSGNTANIDESRATNNIAQQEKKAKATERARQVLEKRRAEKAEADKNKASSSEQVIFQNNQENKGVERTESKEKKPQENKK